MYQDGTRNASKADDAVAPGETITMTWTITSDFAPTEDDPSCLPFSYHSHSDPEMGINSGLVGLLFVCKPGKCTHEGPRDGIKNKCHICIQNIRLLLLKHFYYILRKTIEGYLDSVSSLTFNTI